MPRPPLPSFHTLFRPRAAALRAGVPKSTLWGAIDGRRCGCWRLSDGTPIVTDAQVAAWFCGDPPILGHSVPRQWLTLSQASVASGINGATLSSAITRGDLAAERLGCGWPLVTLAAIRAYCTDPSRIGQRGRPRPRIANP